MKQSPLSLLKNIALIALTAVAFNSAKAQQIPQYSQYYINPFLYNPAAAGMGSDWNAYALYRDQWAGFPGAPVTKTLTIDGPVKLKKIGLGLNIYNDAIGITNRTGASVNYSYRVNFNKDNHLTFGLATGILMNQIDFSKQKLRDNTESTTDLNTTQTAFDASFGAIYEFRDLQVGFALPQMVGSSLTYVSQGDTKSYYTLSRHYMTSLKYVFDVSVEKRITAYPLILVRASQGAPVQYDINAVVDWKNTAWAAVAYKSSGAISCNIGIRYAGASLGYAYDVANGPVGAVAGSSSEFLLGYSFRVGSSGEGLAAKRERTGEIDKTVSALSDRVKQLMDEKDQDKKSIDTLKEKISKMSRVEFSKNMDPEMGVVYRLKSISYDVKSSELDKKDKKVLNDVAEFLESNPNVKIDIQSHTDDMGEAENNYKLSEARAKAVYDYLVEKGIDEDRLSYKAFGESMPLELGSDPKTREKNRRTEFIIISKFYSKETK